MPDNYSRGDNTPVQSSAKSVPEERHSAPQTPQIALAAPGANATEALFRYLIRQEQLGDSTIKYTAERRRIIYEHE